MRFDQIYRLCKFFKKRQNFEIATEVNVLLYASDIIYVLLDNGDGILLMRTDMAGNSIWTPLYGKSRDEAATIAEAADGNIIMVSYALSNIDAVVDPHGQDHRRVSLLPINAWTGNPIINAMHTYDLELCSKRQFHHAFIS